MVCFRTWTGRIISRSFMATYSIIRSMPCRLCSFMARLAICAWCNHPCCNALWWGTRDRTITDRGTASERAALFWRWTMVLTPLWNQFTAGHGGLLLTTLTGGMAFSSLEHWWMTGLLGPLNTVFSMKWHKYSLKMRLVHLSSESVAVPSRGALFLKACNHECHKTIRLALAYVMLFSLPLVVVFWVVMHSAHQFWKSKANYAYAIRAGLAMIGFIIFYYSRLLFTNRWPFTWLVFALGMIIYLGSYRLWKR